MNAFVCANLLVMLEGLGQHETDRWITGHLVADASTLRPGRGLLVTRGIVTAASVLSAARVESSLDRLRHFSVAEPCDLLVTAAETVRSSRAYRARVIELRVYDPWRKVRGPGLFRVGGEAWVHVRELRPVEPSGTTDSEQAAPADASVAVPEARIAPSVMTETPTLPPGGAVRAEPSPAESTDGPHTEGPKCASPSAITPNGEGTTDGRQHPLSPAVRRGAAQPDPDAPKQETVRHREIRTPADAPPIRARSGDVSKLVRHANTIANSGPHANVQPPDETGAQKTQQHGDDTHATASKPRSRSGRRISSNIARNDTKTSGGTHASQTKENKVEGTGVYPPPRSVRPAQGSFPHSTSPRACAADYAGKPAHALDVGPPKWTRALNVIRSLLRPQLSDVSQTRTSGASGGAQSAVAALLRWSASARQRWGQRRNAAAGLPLRRIASFVGVAVEFWVFVFVGCVEAAAALMNAIASLMARCLTALAWALFLACIAGFVLLLVLNPCIGVLLLVSTLANNRNSKRK